MAPVRTVLGAWLSCKAAFKRSAADRIGLQSSGVAGLRCSLSSCRSAAQAVAWLSSQHAVRLADDAGQTTKHLLCLKVRWVCVCCDGSASSSQNRLDIDVDR